MTDRKADGGRHPQVVFDSGVVRRHVLPTPRLVLEHVCQGLEVPFVGNNTVESGQLNSSLSGSWGDKLDEIYTQIVVYKQH